MKKYLETENYVLYNSDMRNMQEDITPNSIDSIICDPPYELGFMGKSWDSSGIAFQKETWQYCYNVLKPGGYLLAFGGSRTFHRIACAIEDAGFEIRDTIMWLYGSGFPKSMNIGLAIDKKNGVESKVIGSQTKGSSPLPANHNGNWCDNQKDGKFDIKQAQNEWEGFGTALKPAYEPIIVARKPVEGSCVDNVMKYGVGGINIDECRVGNETIKGGTMPDLRDVGRKQKEISGIDKLSFGQISNAARKDCEDHDGRFPANVILTYDDTDKDEVCGGFPNTKSTKTNSKLLNIRGGNYNNSNKSLDISYERVLMIVVLLQDISIVQRQVRKIEMKDLKCLKVEILQMEEKLLVTDHI